MPSKAKYWRETDSEQVPRGKDEKNFGKRVKQYVKLMKGKRLKSVVSSGNQPRSCWVYFPSDGSASVSAAGQGPWERGISGCVIALGQMQWPGLRNSARREAGTLVVHTNAPRMLA